MFYFTYFFIQKFMKSSYNNNDINYGDIIKTILFNRNPQKIVEFGILDGFSLKIFADTFPNSNISAFDIFEEFNGNSATSEVYEKFKEYKNVLIQYGDFYKKLNDFENKSIDIIHVDIANNGDVYKFAIENYLSKIKDDGILILEGGSEERDNISWMIKYNKPKIQPILKTEKYNILTIGKMPSITFITKKINIHELVESDFNKGFFELVNHFTKELNPESKDKAKNNIKLFNNENTKTLVIEYDNKIIATGKILLETKIHNNLRKVGHIGDFVISEEYRNKGFGKELLKELVKIGKDNDCYKTVLECNPDVTGFYEKNGFQKKGTEMSLYY